MFWRGEDEAMDRQGKDVDDNELVAEIVELATRAAAPDAAKADKAQLRERLSAVLAKGWDDVVELAIAAAPNGVIAYRIRRSAESICERMRIQRDGVDIDISLFSVAVITTFDEAVPVSQFETALEGLMWSTELGQYLREKCAQASNLTILPRFFRIDEIDSVPLSAVRRSAFSLAGASGDAQSASHPFLKMTGSLKRSAAFLRYLIGHQNVTEQASPHDGQRKTCDKIKALTLQLMNQRIGQCTVDAFYTGAFYEPLYAGMWSYQETRLDQISRQAWNLTAACHDLEAKIVTHGCRDRFVIRLGFFANDDLLGGRTYVLNARPGEEAGACLERITKRIAAAGISACVNEKFIPMERGFDLGKRRGAEPSLIAIPI